MADLTAKQIAWLRSELGDQPDNPTLQAAYDRLHSIRDVAIEQIRTRRNELLASPLAVNLSGVASVNYAENVKAYERRLTALINLDDDPTDEPGEAVDGAGPRRGGVVHLTRTRGR